MPEELKQCPFCGSVDMLRQAFGNPKQNRCTKCGAEGPNCYSAEDADAAWNRRALEPGTSVIRWTRYDGTPGTLPEDGKFILHSPFDRLRICLFHNDLDGEENRISSTFAASVSWRMMLGDIWAYLPDPPEGME